MMIVSVSAFADLSEKFQAKCSTTAAKNAMGANGSCKIVVAPNQKDTQGMCYATLKDTPCKLEYMANFDGGPMSLRCGMMIGDEPDLVKIAVAGAVVRFNVGTFIKKSNGKGLVQIDTSDYYQLSSPELVLDLTIKTEPNGTQKTESEIAVTYQGESLKLTNVICM
jgi:hypothetical protein